VKKILVATDGSATASAAIDAAIEFAAEEHRELVFARVISILDFAPQVNGIDGPAARMPRAEDDAILSDAIARAHGRGIAATAELLIGDAPQQILRVARNLDADVIVVGSRGLGSIKSIVLGSTSREVLAKADRPVMVVHATGIREMVGS
jgi:nucleotide-binding universal stress UspA family protein